MAKVFLVLLCIALAKVSVYGPEGLKSKIHTEYGSYEIPSSLANFGNPPYGSHIIGRLYDTLPGDNLACGPISPMDMSFGDPDMIITPILLLDRGNCSFVQKIRHAQDIGVSAVLIADNVDNEDPKSVLMSDDGTGGNLNIPSFLITKKDGERFRESFRETTFRGVVSVMLTFEMQHGISNVTYEIWMSSDQSLVRAFLNDFAPYAEKLYPVTVFTPHYVLWYCSECRKGGYKHDNVDCVSHGRYCAPDPDGVGPLTGKHVVIEDLRQICVFKEAREKWWSYIREMNSTCPTDKYHLNCSSTALSNAGISKTDIDNCMEKSFEQTGNYSSDNKLLKKERDELIKAGIFFFPAIIINTQTMRGDIEALEVAQGICAGFQESPEECKAIFRTDVPVEPWKQEGISMGMLLAIVCAAIILLAGVLVVYRMWLKREINSELKKQINLAVGQYFALADTSREEA